MNKKNDINIDFFKKYLEEMTDEKLFNLIGDVENRPESFSEEKGEYFDFFAANLYYPSDEELFFNSEKILKITQQYQTVISFELTINSYGQSSKDQSNLKLLNIEEVTTYNDVDEFNKEDSPFLKAA